MTAMTLEERAGIRRAMARTALAVVLAVVTVAVLLDPGWPAIVLGSEAEPTARVRAGAALGAALSTCCTAVAAGLAWRRVVEGS